MLSKDWSNKLFKISALVTIIVVIGKIFGFVRDAIIASFYGATWQTDAFFLAQSLPSVIFPAVCNSVSTAFLSVYVSKIVSNENEADKYASKMLCMTAVISLFLSIAGILLLPILIPILAPGFNSAQTQLSIYLSRIVLATFILTMGQYMFSSILSSRKLFYGAQIAGLFYNLTVILLVFAFGKNQSMYTLTWSVVCGHIIQITTLIMISLKRFKFSWPSKIFDKDSFLLFNLTFPILIGNSIIQINNIVDRILASFVAQGAVSSLSYSNTLNRFVTGIIITTLSTVLYPYFAESYAKNDLADFSKRLKQSCVSLLMCMLPVSIMTVVFSSDIVRIVYMRGNFGKDAFFMTATLLTFYGGMYIFSSLQELITRAFYAMKDTKTPLKVASLAILANSVLSIILTRFIGIGGIALGTTLSTMLAAYLLLHKIGKYLPGFHFMDIFPSIKKMTLAGLIIIFVSYACSLHLVCLKPFLRFGISIVLNFSVYFGLLYLFKCQEVLNLVKIIKQKIEKNLYREGSL
ncbi:MAG: murein biosynthesis integral membrane protein MurJ [Elusimicrobiaceae bacterium]|nr:murein biosynthesis integral membrane protein MurJ [Elusimicrobiaceae bacterium]